MVPDFKNSPPLYWQSYICIAVDGFHCGVPDAEHLVVQLGPLLLRYHARLHPAGAPALFAALLKYNKGFVVVVAANARRQRTRLKQALNLRFESAYITHL